MNTGTVITGDNIKHFRLLAMRQALKLEALGLKRRGASVLSILRKEGLVKARTAKAALIELDAVISGA
jgi:hypothetical protein